jgi:hypothetical protein
MTSNLNSDSDNDHPHSDSFVLLFNCLQRGRIIRQVEILMRHRFKTDLARFLSIAAWVIVGMIWTFCSAFTVVLYPLWESRAALAQIATGIVKVQYFSSVTSFQSLSFFPRCDVLGRVFSRKRKVQGTCRSLSVVKRSWGCMWFVVKVYFFISRPQGRVSCFLFRSAVC